MLFWQKLSAVKYLQNKSALLSRQNFNCVRSKCQLAQVTGRMMGAGQRYFTVSIKCQMQQKCLNDFKKVHNDSNTKGSCRYIFKHEKKYNWGKEKKK